VGTKVSRFFSRAKKLDELIVKVDTQSKQMRETLDDMHGRLVDSDEERAPRTENTDMHEYFLIFKLNNPNYD
jgi:uncharacterized membrane protein